ncbi:MAG: SRPBCC family protein [Dehalococcoidia bacterium]
MPANDYHFITRWRVRGTTTGVADVISDAEGLPRWWPAVYLDVRELEPGEPSGVGKVIDLYTRGWLPYTLRWRFQVTESDYPTNLAIEASGDFNGTGRWSFAEDGDFTDVTYDWRIRANKPLLRHLSWLMKPVFSANHRWAMARGRESLELELARRTAPTLEERLAVPSPPGPAPSGRLLLATAAVVATAATVFTMRFRRSSPWPRMQAPRP